MSSQDDIHLDPSDIIIIDPSQDDEFPKGCEESAPFLAGARKALLFIQEHLQSVPAVLNTIKACIPEHTLQAVLTEEQKQKLADGLIKFVVRKSDNNVIGVLQSTVDGKFDSQVALQDVTSVPNLSQAIASFQSQMQMAQIAEQIREVQAIIEDVRQGLERDRLATAYSCKQKLLQAMKIQNLTLKQSALLRIACDAEDSRNVLMLSQSAAIDELLKEPVSFFGKLINGSSNEKIQARMKEVRDSLEAVSMVSLTEAMAYQELGEPKAAQQSLQYYADFLQQAYLSRKDCVSRLDLIDPSPKNYWSENLPKIRADILALPCMTDAAIMIESGNEENE